MRFCYSSRCTRDRSADATYLVKEPKAPNALNEHVEAPTCLQIRAIDVGVNKPSLRKLLEILQL